MAFLPLIGATMKLKGLELFASELSSSPKMPILFLGHGSPMNAIEDNEFVQGFKSIAKTIEKPAAILCVSAHWETNGTLITHMESPRTIHDFGGFPKALYEVQYPAPGYPSLAEETQKLITSTSVGLDEQWGLDHGAWSVLKHLYPEADVPVLQLSIDYTKPAEYHYNLAMELAKLREKGVLIVGSGNMVHNLGMIAWDKIHEDSYGYDWAIEANDKMKSYIENEDHKSLIDFQNQGEAFKLAIPTPEHFIPLLYTLGLKNKDEEISFWNDKQIMGSLSMTSIKIG